MFDLEGRAVLHGIGITYIVTQVISEHMERIPCSLEKPAAIYCVSINYGRIVNILLWLASQGFTLVVAKKPRSYSLYSKKRSLVNY